MYYKVEFNLEAFEAWSGAIDTKNTIIENNKTTEFEDLLENIFTEERPTATAINDFLWFNSDYIYESLEIEVE